MPVFTVQGPQGEEYEIEAPEGATKEQAFEFFKREHSAGRVKPKQNKPSAWGEVVAGAKGTGAFIGDALSSMVKIPAAAALAVGGKVADPSLDLQKHWESAQSAVEDTFPSFGKGMENNLGYEAPMYPFQKYGEGIEYVAKKAGDYTGSPDLQGSINIAGQFLPVPFAKPVGKGVAKGLAALDPSLRNISSSVEADLAAKRGNTSKKVISLEELLTQEKKPVAAPLSDFEAAALQEAKKRQTNAEQAALLETEIARNQRLGERTAYDNGISDQTMYGGKDGVYTPDNMLVENAIREQDFNKTKQEAADALMTDRQQAMEFDVQRQAALEQQARMRQQQGAAPTGYSEWLANRNVEDATRSAEQIGRMNADPEAQGHLDFNDFGNNDPMERMPEMRYDKFQNEQRVTPFNPNVDENGMPIRADLSMELQNLENPLQRNLWGDELGPALDQERSLTEAIDSMPPGPERDHAISLLTGQKRVPNSQRGAIDVHALTEAASAAFDRLKKIAGYSSKAPEILMAKQELDKKRKQEIVRNLIGEKSGYLENITTPEEVIAASENAKDIRRSEAIGGKTVSPGINHLAIKTGNPLVKFVRAKTREIFNTRNRLTEQYITGQEGIGSVIKKMSGEEKAEAVQLLQLGDRKQQRITREMMDTQGFTEAQKQFVEKFYEMDQRKLDVWNENLEKAGMPLVKERAGHVPGIFNGDYKQLVMVDEPHKSKDGTVKMVPTVKGVIAVDRRGQLKAAQAEMLKKFPDAKFTNWKRSSLGGSGAQSKNFGDLTSVLKLLAENDPVFAEVHKEILAAVANENNKAFGAEQHSLRKKGVVGNAGNKPWLDAETNANEFIKSYLRHWEEQITGHLSLPVEKEVRALMENPALKNMTNAKDYVDSYLRNMGGNGVGELGTALNKILDTPSRWVGLGPSVTREGINQFNKRMGQWSMGFGNYLFSLAQLLQVFVSGVPELTSAAKQLGINANQLAPSMLSAAKEWTSAGSGKASPTFIETLNEARNRGLLTFSEFEDVGKITQSKASKAFDKVVDFNRAELGEKPTRPLVFFTAVDILRKNGYTGRLLYDSAYNITQAGMIDYSTHERAQIYSKAGVVGQLGGALSTYKHGYLGQLNRIAQNAKNDPGSAAYAAVALLATGGIIGIPGYGELDTITKMLTKQLGKEQSLAEVTLENVPTWLTHGAVSDMLNVNMQGKLSSASLIPDTPIEAVSPWFSKVGKIYDAGKDVASYNDQLAYKNLGLTLTPEGPLKGLAEDALMTDDSGYVLDKKGLRGNTRNDWDRAVRKYSGGRSLDEARTGENQYQSQRRMMNAKETQKSVLEEGKRMLVQGRLTKVAVQELAAKYQEAQGDPKQFVNGLIAHAKIAKLDKQSRLQGIPTNQLSSIYRYMEFSDDVVNK